MLRNGLKDSRTRLLEVFPHWCRIYRMEGETEFVDGKLVILYEGECRDEGNAAMRTYQTDGVMKSDHALQIPYLVKGVTNDCRLDVKNDCITMEGLTMTNCQPFRYGERVGTTVMYNEVKN